MQAQYDYLAGCYPVAKEDAAQLCALQIQAELGATLRDREDALEGLLEKYMTKQVLTACSCCAGACWAVLWECIEGPAGGMHDQAGAVGLLVLHTNQKCSLGAILWDCEDAWRACWRST